MTTKYFGNEVTVQGSAKWFKVNTVVNSYEGEETGYVADVYFSDSDTQALIEKTNALLETAKASDEFKNAKTGKPLTWREKPRVPYATDAEGKVFFRFKTSHKDKDGNRKYVPCFDAKNNPMKNDVAIGNGSLVQISYTPSANHQNSEANGIKYFLNAIRVIKLESAASANPFGDPVDGYVAEQDTPFGNTETSDDICL